MSQVQQLYLLQQIDTEIQEKKKRLGDVLQAQKATGELLTAKERVATAVADLHSWQTKQQDLNLAQQTLKNKAKSAENRLYSGNVKNPKELTDLQSSIASLGRQQSALEDEILEAMIMIEDAETEKEAATETVQTLQAEWDQTLITLKKEQNKLALRVHTLMGQRTTRLNTISAESLAEYDIIRKRKRGIAVTKIENGVCSGCRLNVSALKQKNVREGKKVFCAGCNRILAA